MATMPSAPGRDPLDRGARVGQEVLLEQQVLGRVAGDRQLGEEHELRAGVARLGDAGEDARLVAGDVADDRVELGEGDPHVGAGARRAARRGVARDPSAPVAAGVRASFAGVEGPDSAAPSSAVTAAARSPARASSCAIAS